MTSESEKIEPSDGDDFSEEKQRKRYGENHKTTKDCRGKDRNFNCYLNVITPFLILQIPVVPFKISVKAGLVTPRQKTHP